ncbi:MAG: hypothetical protein B7X60_02075 [Polynucleobacter sp. 39-45-136]|nr:MAG: hypothetical protein B7X60_02075 [Polynucleobacter sp. 39-45-136]
MSKGLKNQALLIGHHFSLMRALPKLLNRAGFEVDVITTDVRCAELRSVRRIQYATDSAGLISIAANFSCTPFDLFIVCDDEVLLELVRSNLSDELKIKLLPICAVDNLSHLGTKIAFSNLLKSSGILTPKFTVANNADELTSTLRKIPYPVLLKNDISAGGAGVFAYFQGDDIAELLRQPLSFPLLIQRRIDGDAIDLSAFYQNGELIHFSYAVMNTFANNQFGPSIIRTYSQLSTVPSEVFEQLRKLGRALGAHGFANITSLRDYGSGKHFLVEADMRPNVWVDYARYLGNDPAQAIRKFFDSGSILGDKQFSQASYPKQLKIPYIYRLTALEILTNRHNVWRFCREFSTTEIVGRVIRLLISQHVKSKFSERNWQYIKRACSFVGVG